MLLRRYESEEYNVDETQNIDEIMYFEAEDFKVLELVNETSEEFKVKEIEERIIDVSPTIKKSNDESFTKKISQLKSSINSFSSTAVTTSMVAVTAVIGVGTVLPEISLDSLNSPISDYGEIEYLNYALDYDENTKLTLFFNEELDDGIYCVVINKETNEQYEVLNGSVTFEDITLDEYTFEINILDSDNYLLSNERINLDLTDNLYKGFGACDYTITYNDDNTSNLYILLKNQDDYNSTELYLTRDDKKLSYEPITNNDLIIFENIVEEDFLLDQDEDFLSETPSIETPTAYPL